MGLHIGLDLHKKFSQVTVMDDEGNILDRQRLDNDPEVLREYFSALPPGSCVTMEATGNWYWVCDLLEELGLKVKLAHPKKVKFIAEAAVKTDNVDSEVLVHLERCNFLPTSYIPPKEIRDVRELLRYQISLVKISTSIKNRIHALLAKRGIRHEFSDLFGRAGLGFLSGLELPDIYRYALDGYLKLLGDLKGPLSSIEKRIKRLVEKESEAARLLMSIPGISYFSALLLDAEIGDINRFPSFRRLCAYAGVVPGTRESGDKVHQGHLIKDSNKYIRWILLEAAPKAARQDPRLASHYFKVLKKKGKGKAKVAVARKILISIYYMLKNHSAYKLSRPNKRYIVRRRVWVSPGQLLAIPRLSGAG